jgi:collagenase-like PrtC family protease
MKSKMSCFEPLSESPTIDDGFPLGSAALHPDWPEGRFTVSGMFSCDPGILFFLKIAELGFGCRVGIEAVHGAPFVLWNGGRLDASLEFNPANLVARLDSINSQGLGCFLTFTNHLLEPGDLDDPACNLLLDGIALRPDLNGVIVNSDMLSRYIARRYPGLRQIASVTKVVAEGGRGNVSYYNELGKRFYRYVVHLDDCQDRRLLDQLDRTKAEIIVNENCSRGCQRRARHYELTAQLQKFLRDRRLIAAGGPGDALLRRRRAERELEEFMADCPARWLDHQIHQRSRSCNLTRRELKSLYDMGFRYFKIQGRDNIPYCFAYDLTRYTLEPGFAAPFVYKILCAVILRSLTAAQGQAPQGPVRQ